MLTDSPTIQINYIIHLYILKHASSDIFQNKFASCFTQKILGVLLHVCKYIGCIILEIILHFGISSFHILLKQFASYYKQ